ncbi:MAG: hypothetical protein A49_08930 [Methyloceanibacter sp.]|nr:MAG: hypothetical protein A49_08930 [Methyloceanibacter sp.]
MQNRDDENEGKEVPVGDIDMRLLPARQGAQIEREVGHPYDHQPDIRIPFGLGILLGLGDAERIAGDGKDTKKDCSRSERTTA